MKRALAILLVTAWLGGCVSQVRTGAIIGGLSGAAAGAGVGYAIGDEDVLGSGGNPAQGPVDLPKGPTLAAGALIGAVFGAIAGAMIGHRTVPDFEAPEEAEPAEPATGDDEATARSRAHTMF